MTFETKRIDLAINLRVTGDVAIPIKWGKRDFFPRDVIVDLSYWPGRELEIQNIKAAGPIEKNNGLPGEAWSRDNCYWTMDGQFGDETPDPIREIAEAALLIAKEHWK